MSVTFNNICESLSPVLNMLLRHLKINSLKSFSRKVQAHPEAKFFVIIRFGVCVSVILANPITVVRSSTVRD